MNERRGAARYAKWPERWFLSWNIASNEGASLSGVLCVRWRAPRCWDRCYGDTFIVSSGEVL